MKRETTKLVSKSCLKVARHSRVSYLRVPSQPELLSGMKKRLSETARHERPIEKQKEPQAW